MKQKAYQVAVPVTFVVVMVAFLAAIFFANANLSFAASGTKKSSAVSRTSAVEHTEAQIKQLQGALNFTKAQEELSNNLTKVMRENAKDMDALFTKARAEKTQTRNAVEQMKFHSQITEAQLDQMKKVIPPFEALYASMSDEQKKSTDTIFQTGRYGKSKRK
ncbi:MAG: Spy/CpxP family protein refolding chaperone [Deltaproteobacteria bacterium]|nr:Spy/CpxP family protein refolding chaperone [Deltaproteobacteria bacterium]